MRHMLPGSVLALALTGLCATAADAQNAWRRETFYDTESAVAVAGWAKLQISCQMGKPLRVNLHVEKDVAPALKEGYFIGMLAFIFDGSGDPVRVKTSIGSSGGSASFGPLPGPDTDALVARIAAAKQNIRVAIEDSRSGAVLEYHVTTFPVDGAATAVKAMLDACRIRPPMI